MNNKEVHNVPSHQNSKEYFNAEFLKNGKFRIAHWLGLIAILLTITHLPSFDNSSLHSFLGFCAIFVLLISFYILRHIGSLRTILKISFSILTFIIIFSLVYIAPANPTELMLWFVSIIIASYFFISRKWALGFFSITMVGITIVSLFYHYDFNMGEYLTGEVIEDSSILNIYSPLKIGIPLVTIVLILIDFMRNHNKKNEKLLSHIELKENLLKDISEKEKVLSTILESSGDAIYELNGKGELVYCNKELLNLTGYKEEELIGKDLNFLIDKEYLDRCLNAIYKQVIAKKRVQHHQIPIINKNGDLIWLGLTVTLFYDENGHPIKAINIARNITKQKATKDYLILAKEKAEDVSLAKARFLSSMSHEIRTPMNAIIGIINLMQDSDNEELNQQIDSLRFSSNNLLNLVNDILDYNELDRDNLKLKPKQFNIRDMINYVAMGLDDMASNKSIDFKLNIDERIPKTIYGDPLRLSQILNNLTHNAIKFTKKGSVTVDVIQHAQTVDKVDLFIGITDTGIGIPQDKKAIILQEFAQVERSTIREGAGLGLSITSKLLKLYKTRIHIESDEGVGSKFSFIISFKKAAVSDTIGSPRNDSGSFTRASKEHSFVGKKILIVEDNLINQKVMRKVLEKWGTSVDIAENGKVGVEMVEENNYDLILMDLQMPVMNGIEATIAIRAKGGDFNDLPIIALTASAVVEVKEEALKTGMNYFMTKPFRPDLLYQKLCEYLQIPQSA